MNYSADKLGYYQVGDYKTYRKFLAISEHRRSGLPVNWSFNDQEFGSYSWTQCPSKSLSDLYRMRAEQLRNDYEVIVLFYSGGSDSQTILDTFLKHNIRIDHIICCHSTKGDDSPYGYFSEEITRVAKPYLTSVSDQLTGTQIHFVDQTDPILGGFRDSDWWVDHNNTLTPNCVTRSKLREWYAPMRSLIDSGQTTGFIWGRDKPKILKDDRGYYTVFNDHNDNNTSPYSQSRATQGWYDEFFFQDPSSPDIICRQIHEVTSRLIEQSIPLQFFQTAPTENGQCPHTGQYLTNRGISQIIYPDWDIDTFSNGKNPSSIWGARDRWFFDKYQHSESYSIWHKGVSHVDKILRYPEDTVSWLNTDNLFDNIKGCITPRYYTS